MIFTIIEGASAALFVAVAAVGLWKVIGWQIRRWEKEAAEIEEARKAR